MRSLRCLVVVLMLASPQILRAQTASDADARRFIAELQAGHIRGNVADEAAFNHLLQRDLNRYFAAHGFHNPVVTFELLRRGATQSGVAYPKFYLWARVRSQDRRSTSGAVRVAAIDRQRFDVTNFLSAREINADPNSVGSAFPAPLVQGIIERAASQRPR